MSLGEFLGFMYIYGIPSAISIAGLGWIVWRIAKGLRYAFRRYVLEVDDPTT